MSVYLDPDAASDDANAARIDGWLDKLAPSMMLAMICTHEFDGALCDICWGNVQRVCQVIRTVAARRA